MGAITVLIDSRKLRRIKITCRCGEAWTEQVPSEVHDSWLVMGFWCPSCGTEYHLQNKKLERAASRSETKPSPESWQVPGNGGNA